VAIGGDPLAEIWITSAAKGVKAIDEVNALAVCREREVRPSGLLRESFYHGIQGEETVLDGKPGLDLSVVLRSGRAE